MTTIAFIGDVHGCALHALAALVALQRHRGIRLDAAIQVGDLGAYPTPERWDGPSRRFAAENPAQTEFLSLLDPSPQLSSAVSLALAHVPRILFVSGNHEDFDWLTSLHQAEGATIVPVDPSGACFNLVGIEQCTGEIRRLVAEPTCHIEFPRGFLVPPTWVGVTGLLPYPSWHPGSELVGSGRFGGEVDALCAVCSGPLHRLIAFDKAPTNVPEGLQVATCLSCLGWSQPVLFFAHHGSSVSPAGPDLTWQQPEFPAEALPETTVTIRRSPQRWRLQDWAYSNGRANLNRVGGGPTWIQSPDFPTCPDCLRTMRFLLQLDSLEIEGGPWWLWGSGGILYAFWCDGCSLSATLWQCT